MLHEHGHHQPDGHRDHEVHPHADGERRHAERAVQRRTLPERVGDQVDGRPEPVAGHRQRHHRPHRHAHAAHHSHQNPELHGSSHSSPAPFVVVPTVGTRARGTRPEPLDFPDVSDACGEASSGDSGSGRRARGPLDTRGWSDGDREATFSDVICRSRCARRALVVVGRVRAASVRHARAPRQGAGVARAPRAPRGRHLLRADLEEAALGRRHRGGRLAHRQRGHRPALGHRVHRRDARHLLLVRAGPPAASHPPTDTRLRTLGASQPPAAPLRLADAQPRGDQPGVGQGVRHLRRAGPGHRAPPHGARLAPRRAAARCTPTSPTTTSSRAAPPATATRPIGTTPTPSRTSPLRTDA